MGCCQSGEETLLCVVIQTQIASLDKQSSLADFIPMKEVEVNDWVADAGLTTPHSDQATFCSQDSDQESDSPQAQAALQWGKEVTYTGEFLGSMKHGSGYLETDQCVYDGEFRCDLMNGNGTLRNVDGLCYSGQFQSSAFHGFGTTTVRQGDAFCGQFVESKRQGTGTFMWRDGRCYHGQWISGLRHGVGTYTNARGSTRRGLWHMGLPMYWEPPDPEMEPRPNVVSPSGLRCH